LQYGGKVITLEIKTCLSNSDSYFENDYIIRDYLISSFVARFVTDSLIHSKKDTPQIIGLELLAILRK
jgi:hypothetical protein